MLTNEGHAVADDRDQTTARPGQQLRSSGGVGARWEARRKVRTPGWRPGYHLVDLWDDPVFERRRGDRPHFETYGEFEDAQAEAALTYLSLLARHRGKKFWERAGTLEAYAAGWMNIYVGATDLLVAASQLGLPVRAPTQSDKIKQARNLSRLFGEKVLPVPLTLSFRLADEEQLILLPDPEAFAKAHARTHERWLSKRSKKFWPDIGTRKAA